MPGATLAVQAPGILEGGGTAHLGVRMGFSWVHCAIAKQTQKNAEIGIDICKLFFIIYIIKIKKPE